MMNSPSDTESIESTTNKDPRHDDGHDSVQAKHKKADAPEGLELIAVVPVTGCPVAESPKRPHDDDGSSSSCSKKRRSPDGMRSIMSQESETEERLEPATLQQQKQIITHSQQPTDSNPATATQANFVAEQDTYTGTTGQGGTDGGPTEGSSSIPNDALHDGYPVVAPALKQQPLPQPPISNNLLLEQSRRIQQQISLMLAQLGGSQLLGMSAMGDSGATVDGSNPQLQLALLQQQQLLQSLFVQQQLDSILAQSSGSINNSPTSNTTPVQNNLSSSDLAALLRQVNNTSNLQQANPLLAQGTNLLGDIQAGRNSHSSGPNLVVPAHYLPVQLHQRNQDENTDTDTSPDAPSTLNTVAQSSSSPSPTHELPPCFHGSTEHWSERTFFRLGVDEDPNWLSEFHCFVRTELVELYRAGEEDVKLRNSTIDLKQVGMRCRYCAHCMASGRPGRSSAFPSTLRQIYQSFTMMLRDHFASCEAIPSHLMKQFLVLRDRPAQGATDSKRYWIYSAMKLGMVDTNRGIFMTEASRANGNTAAPFGTNPSKRWDDENYASFPLVLPTDKPVITDFLYLVMSQVQPIRLLESECIGNRRSLPVGLPGFGCRYCCQHRRLGLCRMFPARRRTLPGKIADIVHHLMRCNLCPDNVKEQIQQKRQTQVQIDRRGDREFFDRVWSRLGHESQQSA